MYRYLPLMLFAGTIALACGDSDSSPASQGLDFGPLTVSEHPNGDDALAGIGPISITDECVTLMTESGTPILLVWYSGYVAWDEGNQEIIYSYSNDPPIKIRDGDVVAVGGSGIDPDLPAHQNLDWVATPNPTCAPDQWSVGGIRLGTPVPTESPWPSPHMQTGEEALEQDLELIAEANGWTMEEAVADHRAAEIIGDIAVQVAEQRPDIFIGSALSKTPGGPPILYIKGPADDFVRGLVAAAEIEVNIVDNQPYSFDELEERKLEVHRALEAMGFQNYSIGFRLEEKGQIRAEVTRQGGLPDDVDEIVEGLPESVRGSVTLTLHDEPVAVYD